MYEPIRILHVFAQMNRGGAETMIMNLYRNIDRNKIQFDFMVHTQEECAFDDEIKKLGGKIHRIPSYKGINHIEYSKKWKSFLLENPDYKLIHGHVRSTGSIYLSIAKKLKRYTIIHSHNTSSGNGISAVVKNVLQFPLRYIADYLIACSVTAGEWLYGKNTISNQNFFLLNNAIDTRNFVFNENVRNQKRKELNITEKFVVGHVGRFHPQKNHEFIIEVFHAIYQKNNKAILLLVGEGILQEKIKNKAKQYNLENSIIFAGVRNDIPEILQSMDVFLFPSLYEGLPVTLIEAQASGLKIFASDTISNEVNITNSIINNSLSNPVDKWANNILEYANGYDRTNNLQQIKNAHYDICENTKWLEDFYINIINKKK